MQTYEGSVTSCPGTDIVAMPTLWHQPGNNILTISALGAPHFQIGDKPIVFARRKTAALLLYLAVTRRRHARDVLANLLWGDMPQQSAAANLRKALAELRMRIDGVVVPTRHVVAMNPDYPIVLD